MKVEQVLELVKAVSDSELTEFKYEEDGVKLSLKKTSDKIVQVPAPAAPVAAPVIAPAMMPPAISKIHLSKVQCRLRRAMYTSPVYRQRLSTHQAPPLSR